MSNWFVFQILGVNANCIASGAVDNARPGRAYACCLAKIVQGECNEVYLNCRTVANLMQRYALTMNKCLDTNEKNARQSKKIIER